MKKGLGRGLEALFSIYEEDESTVETAVSQPKAEQPVMEVKSTSVETSDTAPASVKVGPVATSVDISPVNVTPSTFVSGAMPNVTVTPTVSVTPNANNAGVMEISLKQIDPNLNQPRKTFDAESLKELAESIRQHGVIQPIIVNDEGTGRYTIIAGERRYRASLVAGKTTIPAIIRTYTPKQIKEVSLIENLQREDLNPIEAARAIKELMYEYGFTQETVADRIGKSRPLVANTLRLLALAPEVINMIEKGLISAGHGKCLVSIENPEKQIMLAKLAAENKFSVRDLENYIKTYKEPRPGEEIVVKEKPVQSIELKELGHRIARLFKTKVIIKGDDNKGKILIDYFNIDDLDRISNFIASLERK